MPDVYTKRGSSVRWENGTLIRVRETGEAVEDGPLFRCSPRRGPDHSIDVDDRDVIETARRIHSLVGEPLSIERLVVADGGAEHQFGERTWSERSRRVHLSIAHGRHRVLIDRGDFDVQSVETIAAAFARIGAERPAPPRMRFAPRVFAALVPSLIDWAPPNVTIEQAAGGIDGKGEPIGIATAAPWPNWYRPSYRVRPQRTPLNIAIRCSVTTIEPGLPEAIAILAPATGLTMRLLCVDSGSIFPATARIVRIDAVAEPSEWYPFGAGVWGAAAEVAT